MIVLAVLIAVIVPESANAKPIWLKFKLGLLAKWKISLNGDCESAWGICVAFGDNMSPNFFGYDNETDQFYIKVSKKCPEAKSFSGGTYELKEDSPVDPRLISGFPNFLPKGKTVILRKGTYKIAEEADFYVMGVKYYVQ
jgi:hypothetical protein